MVLNEDTVQAALAELILSLDKRRRRNEGTEATATGSLEVAGMADRVLKAVKQDLVHDALANGATWPEIADALGLKSASSAHWHYGPSGDTETVDDARAERLRKLRERRPVAPRQEHPGYSALALSKLSGWPDRRTIKVMGERGDLRTFTVTDGAGRLVVRYEPNLDERGQPVRPASSTRRG